MGFAMELVKARRKIIELESKVAELDATKLEVVSLKSKINNLEKELAPPLPPVIRAEITSAEISTLIKEKFGNLPNVFISDNIEYLCDIADINAFLTQDETNKLQSTGELGFDCDDFAYRLQGQFSIPEWSKIAMGIIWTDTHALNCFIDTNRDFWFIEPQNDNVKSGLEEWQGSSIRVLMI